MKKMCVILSKTKLKKFLEASLPHLSNFLVVESVPSLDEQKFNTSIEESMVTKDSILRLVTDFLGGIGSMAHYICKKGCLENSEDMVIHNADMIKLDVPLATRNISLDLGVLLRRVSELATETTDSNIQSIACELLHALMMVFIGKVSQAGADNEIYVEWLELVMPKLLIIAVSDCSFSQLFSELTLQIARWLAHNRNKDNAVVSSFLEILVTQASQGDRPELRGLCLNLLRQFLDYTIKIHEQAGLTHMLKN